MGRLTVLLKDAPVEVDELWIPVTGFEVHRVDNDNGEWFSLDFSTLTYSLTFNLLEYQDEKCCF